MAKYFISFLVGFIICGWNDSASAQSTILSSSGAKIGTELSIVENADLHFGTMTIPTGAVNVSVTTVGLRSASVPALITLLSQAPVAHQAAYTIYGSKNAHYMVTLPANNTVIITSGANQMNVDNFTIKSTNNGAGNGTGKLNAQGTDTFKIGATLKLANGQPAGTYTGTFTITAAYN